MLGPISRHLLPVLQLTRMALVFTAIADSVATLMLWSKWASVTGRSAEISPHRFAAIAVISIGLYGFGMSLNDIIDRRRDRQIAGHRPLPSGRIDVATAHVICGLLLLASLLAGAAYSQVAPAGWMCFLLVAWTALLIAFYDLAGKYLVALGILTLGLIRFFHAVIPAPQVPLLWHPLLLLNHVVVLSAVAYVWEEKRPPLSKGHWWAVFGGLAIADGGLIAATWWRRGRRFDTFAEALWFEQGLLWPVLAAVLFLIVAVLIRRLNPNPRDAGQKLMLAGLLWLIVYDAAFVLGYVGAREAWIIAMLLPIAYLAVQLMRWWSKIVALSQRPAYKRAEL